MRVHSMKLTQLPFTLIAHGSKTIESRLYDEKRQAIELGDTIIFSLLEDETRILTTQVVGLLRYANFHDLFTCNDPNKFGGSTAMELETQIAQFYSDALQQKYGVIGIELRLIG